MLNSKMKQHSLYRPFVAKNEYNEIIKTFKEYKKVDMIISLNNRANYGNNDTNITNCQYVALVKCLDIEKGMRIDNRYTVEFVIENKLGCYAFLNEVANDGRI